MTAAMTLKDTIRSRVYYNVHELSTYEFIKFSGGDYQVTTQGPGSINVKLVYPPEDRVYCAGIETNTVSGSPNDCWLVIDALSEGDFKNADRLLDEIDKLDIAHMKDNDSPQRQLLQWLALSSEQPHELRVRWAGRFKTLAAGSTLHDRYGKLIRYLRETYATDRAVQDEPFAADVTEETLALRKMALEYNGSSSFPSFLKTRFTQRQIDAYRHGGLDASHSTLRSDLPVPRKTRDGVKPEEVPGMDSVVLDDSRAGEDATVDLVYEGELDASVERELSERERRVYRLKRAGANDRQAGEVLGIARETVNRDKAEIKKVVAKLVPPGPSKRTTRPKPTGPDHT